MYQFGFRKNYSTSQAVIKLHVLDNNYQDYDNKEVTMGIYLDLLEAFDTVDH